MHRAAGISLTFLLSLLMLSWHSGFQSGTGGDDGYRPPGFEEDSLAVIRLNNQAEIYGYLYMLDSAIHTFGRVTESIRPLLQHSRDSLLRALYVDSYFNRGYFTQLKGELDAAKKIQDTTLSLVLEHFGEEHLITTKVYNKFGWMAYAEGDFRKAHHYLKHSLDIRKRILTEPDIFLSHGYNNLSVHYANMNDLEKALEYRQKSLAITRRMLEREDLSLKSLEEIDDAYLKKHAPPLLKDLMLRYGYNILADRYFGVGSLLRLVGNQESAAWHFERGLEILQREKTIGNVRLAFRQLGYGVILAENGEAETGRRIVENTLQKTDQLQGSPAGLKTYANRALGFVALVQQDYDLALRQFKKSIESSPPLPAAEDAYRLAYIHSEKKEWYQALSYLQRGLNLMKADTFLQDRFQPDPETVAHIHPIVLNLYTLKGTVLKSLYGSRATPHQLREVLRIFLTVTHAKQELRSQFQSETSKALLVQNSYQLTELTINTMLELYEKTGEEHLLREVFQLMEENKATTLLEGLQRPEASQIAEVPANLLEREEALYADIILQRKFIAQEISKGEKADTSLIQRWEAGLVKSYEQRDSLRKQFEKDYPDYFQILALQKRTTLEEVQQEIRQAPEKNALVQYFMGDTTLITFTFTGHDFHCTRQTLPRDFHRQLRTFRQAVAQPPADAAAVRPQVFAQAGQSLFRFLLEDKLDSRAYARVTIIPDGALCNLPFELLLDRPVEAGAPANFAGLPYLFRHTAINYEYSSTLLLAKPQREAATGDYLGFAPTYQGEPLMAESLLERERLQRLYKEATRDGLEPLRYNAMEVEHTGVLTGGATLTGRAATEAAFKQQAADRRILHLAMHTLINDEEPLYSQLVFGSGGPGEDGRLHAYELYNMQLNAELAVLSACNTGAGKMLRGEGAMSLARAFKYAGCPNIVMSLWPANDVSTQSIMIDFFANLKKGIGKAEALRQAKLAFLEKEDNFERRHPFFWAGFVLIGDGEPVPFKKPWRQYTWWGLGLAVVVGVLVWRTRKSEEM